MKKQIIKGILLASLASVFVACNESGSGDYVKLTNDGFDQKIFDLANAKIKKEYPNYDLYHYTSVKAEKDIKNPDEKIKMMKLDLEKNKKAFAYNNYVFIKNEKTGDYKVIEVHCDTNFKKEVYCGSNDYVKYYLK